MVAAGKKYDILDPETGKLARSIFFDQGIYEEEMKNIFGRCWLLVAHESLVPNPNDFFLSYMGEDPVIVSRDGNGKLHVLLNMCRHRGNRVMRADKGNSANFLCSYHGWTFSSDGCLNHVPGEEVAYYGDLDRSELGLAEARVDVYAGLIFACWDPEAPTLEDYLGDARWYLDTMFNRYDNGMIAYGPEKWIAPVNWKTPIDNTSDNYHTSVTHLSAMKARNKVYGQGVINLETRLRYPSPDHQTFVNGHPLTFRDLDDPNQERAGAPGFVPILSEAEEEVKRRLGSRASIILRNHSIFPNTLLGFFMAFPRGPQKTEFWRFKLVAKDYPMVDPERGGSGAADLFIQDDMDNWNQVTNSGGSPFARGIDADLSMGMGHTSRHEQFSGQISERYISESNQRQYYERWMEFMNAKSWADIHVEPRTATYDGTAQFHG